MTYFTIGGKKSWNKGLLTIFKKHYSCVGSGYVKEVQVHDGCTKITKESLKLFRTIAAAEESVLGRIKNK
jgi:hypothetical protein